MWLVNKGYANTPRPRTLPGYPALPFIIFPTQIKLNLKLFMNLVWKCVQWKNIFSIFWSKVSSVVSRVECQKMWNFKFSTHFVHSLALNAVLVLSFIIYYYVISTQEASRTTISFGAYVIFGDTVWRMFLRDWRSEPSVPQKWSEGRNTDRVFWVSLRGTWNDQGNQISDWVR